MSDPSLTIPRVFPLDSDDSTIEKAIEVYETSLARNLVAILKDQGANWDTCSFDRYGKDMKTLTNNPPTILVSTSDINQPAWAIVRTKVKDAISAAGISVPFEVIPSTFSLLYGADDPWGARLPFSRPLQMGDGVSMKGEGVGTIGGFLQVKRGIETLPVGMSNNHVVNIQPADAAWDTVDKTTAIVSPSEQDNIFANKWLQTKYQVAAARFISLLPALREPLSNILTHEFPKHHPGEQEKNWESAKDFQKKDLSLEYGTMVKILGCLNNAKAAQKCTISGPLSSLYTAPNGQTSLINQVKDDGNTVNSFKKGLDDIKAFDRKIGTVEYSSGLRLTDGENKSVLDWALIKLNKDLTGVNECKELRVLANTISPESALAKGEPIQEFATLQPNAIVFKVGRTTGPTAGRVARTKQILSGTLLQQRTSRKDSPFQKVTYTHERRIYGIKIDDHEQVPDMESSFSTRGDSGSWIVDERARVVGLLWAGDSVHTMATDMAVVINSIKESCNVEVSIL